jgi:hypothetical protein
VYAAGYVHPDGFGSIGFIADIAEARIGGAAVTLTDPALGEITVPAHMCDFVVHTETGTVLPYVEPSLSPSITSPWLLPEHMPQAVAANAEPISQFVSGYPIAFERVRRWREDVAPDWRTVALVAIFARTTIRTDIRTAERSYREFGPVLRDVLTVGVTPTAEEMLGWESVRRLGTQEDRVRDYLSLIEWAPEFAAKLAISQDFSRRFRDKEALEYVPAGIALPKFSFVCSLLGRDAACLDGRIMGDWFGKEAKKVAKTFGDKTAAGAFSPMKVRRYIDLEDKLRDSEFFDPDAPMPYAKAQWMLWETIGRTAGPASHESLWDVIG